MTRYWVIAPYNATQPEIWERVWQYDQDQQVISIGWRELGDFSGYSKDKLRDEIEHTYSYNTTTTTRVLNMLWNFYHEIKVDDIIVARKGRKCIAAIGTVKSTAKYSHAKNEEAIGALANDYHSHYIEVQWHDSPRDVEFEDIVFSMQTIYDIPESRYKSLTKGPSDELDPEIEEGVKDQKEFRLKVPGRVHRF